MVEIKYIMEAKVKKEEEILVFNKVITQQKLNEYDSLSDLFEDYIDGIKNIYLEE